MFGAVRQQAITRTNVGQICGAIWRHEATVS